MHPSCQLLPQVMARNHQQGAGSCEDVTACQLDAYIACYFARQQRPPCQPQNNETWLHVPISNHPVLQNACQATAPLAAGLTRSQSTIADLGGAQSATTVSGANHQPLRTSTESSRREAAACVGTNPLGSAGEPFRKCPWHTRPLATLTTELTSRWLLIPWGHTLVAYPGLIPTLLRQVQLSQHITSRSMLNNEATAGPTLGWIPKHIFSLCS